MTATKAPDGPPPAEPAAPARTPGTAGDRRRRPFLGNPWRHPWFLEGFTWLYLVWSLVPIVIAVLFSFNNGRSQSSWQGFSWRWYFSDPVNSVLHDPQLHAAVIQTVRLSVLTTVIAVPIGVAFALGINRWRGPVPGSFNFVMILSYVIPELIFGVSMFFVFTTLFASVHLGTLAQVLALVTWNVSWPAIVVQARLVTIGRQYEEAAADLGANQFQVMRRVMVPLLAPAIFASAVPGLLGRDRRLRDRQTCSPQARATPRCSVIILLDPARRSNGGTALNALGSIMLAMSLVIVIITATHRLPPADQGRTRRNGP